VMNGGTLSLGFDASGTVGGIVNVLADSTIIADRASAGAGGTALTLSTLTMGSNTLTVKPGENVTSGTIGLTLGSVFLGGASMRPGNPTFDVQSSANAALTLTLGSFTDQFIAPRTITFQNSGTSPSTVTLATAATALVNGTLINIANTGGAVSVNLNIASALGTLARVNVDSGNTLTLGAAQTLASISGSGTINASGAGFTLTVGNALNSPALDSTFSGVLANGAAPSPLTLIKTGKGTLTLSGSSSNAYTGLTTVSAGTLVLAKTGGALAVGGGLTIGNAAASTVGRATVRLDGNDQIISTAALIMNGGSTLNLNGFSQTVLTFSSAFGATITGPGTLAVATTSGTMTFTGASSISGNLQLTTGTAATRTMAITSVNDQLTISGSVSQGTTTGSIVAGNSAQTALGTLILSGENSYAGTTTVSSGILNVRHGSALGTVAGITTITAGATLQIQNDITTLAEPLTVRGTGFAGAAGRNFQTGAVVNVSGTNNYAGLLTLGAAATVSSDSGTLNLTHVGTITGATFGLTLAGSGNGSIASIIGITNGAVTKNGTGTWTLKGVNTSTGAITINAGTLMLGDGSIGSWSTAPALTFTGSGTFQYGGSTAATTQALGALTLTSGSGTLQVDAPASGDNALTFSSLAVPALGSGLNIVSPANTSVTLINAVDTNGIINARLTYNGSDFASSTAGLMAAAATTTATSSLLAGNAAPYLISGSFAQTASITANAGLKFAGNDTLTIHDGSLLAINNGTGTAGGILVAGGVSAVIANQGSATGLTTDGGGDLVIRTNAANDSLSLQVPIAGTTTGGLTKNGAGALTLSAPSTYTGATSVNEGTLILGNATALSGSAATVQVGAVLDLNEQNITNAATLNGTGIGGAGALINNTGTATVGALTIGLGHGTGGIGASIGGSGNIQSTGILSGNNLLVKTGSGTLTFGDNSGSPLASTRTGTTRIDDGTLRLSYSSTALGAAIAQLVLNGGTLSLGTTTSVAAHPTAVTASSSIISDVFTTGAGLVHTLGVLSIGDQTLTISAGANVTTEATNAGVTFGATTLLGSPTFDVQSPTTATNGTTTLTLGALNDQGIAKTITFTNSGTATMNSLVTLATAAGSLMEGTVVHLNQGTNAGVTLNLNLASALGTFAQVNVSEKSRLNIGAAQTIASLAGNGTVSASGAFTLTVGNANSSPALSTTFAGSLTNGSGTLTFAKNGLGTLTLSGLNSYTGTTTVSAGILKLGSATALGTTSGVLVAAGGTLDLNGQTVDRNLTSIVGVGHEGNGALINSNSTTATLTGTFVLGSYARIGGSGNITINNAGGITGNLLLTKFGNGTLRVVSAAASARTGTNQIDEGTLRLEAATGFAPIGTGAMALNGGTLSLGFDTSGTVGGVVNLLADSTIVADRASTGEGGIMLTLSTLTIGGNTLTVKGGDNVTNGNIGLTLGTTLIGGAMLAGGDPVFDVQSSANATTTLTLGSLSDQAIAPRTITFQNSSANASVVTLATAATSLVNGTMVNI
ncbi:MAG: autotransporter-associated beta strand repeat-containing protein, partial [Prosthecobacter sp.]|nr:autotransporter-associated beta strand repeat-containing protein [Prosthecobacter sp.]